ncbi:MAG: FAD-dependent monooxygenase [Archangium sp.]
MKVLISGAGIGGCTLAWWLGNSGHEVTVVERSQTQRSSGAPVDVEGPAVEIVEAMGVMGRLRDAATRVSGMRFVDARGREAVRVDTSSIASARRSRDVELPRGDLARVLEDAARERASFVFGDHLTSLAQDDDGVSVGFASGKSDRFELVVGADGLHSGVRKLLFGDEAQFINHQGLYVATLPLPAGDEGHDIVMFNAPGRSLTLHPSRSRAMAAFIFWSPQVTFDVRDESQQRSFIERTFANDGWRVPEILKAIRETDELYFDSVSRVSLPKWSRGRVALLGDAASCVSLFGGGSSLAIRGAWQLARSLQDRSLSDALTHYEREHRKTTDPRTRGMSSVASLLIPKSAATIWARNAALHLWPIFRALGRLRPSGPSLAPAR